MTPLQYRVQTHNLVNTPSGKMCQLHMTTNEGITAMVMVPISEASKYMVDTVVEVNFKVVA